MNRKERIAIDMDIRMRKKVFDYCRRRGLSVSAMTTVLWELYLGDGGLCERIGNCCKNAKRIRAKK